MMFTAAAFLLATFSTSVVAVRAVRGYARRRRLLEPLEKFLLLEQSNRILLVREDEHGIVRPAE